MQCMESNVSGWQPSGRQARWYEWLLILLLFAMAGGARAGTIYKCHGADHAVAYQAAPCGEGQRETTVAIDPAPAYAPAPQYAVAAPERERMPRSTRAPLRARREPVETSYECRTSDGQVFYRHAACPHSVPALAAEHPSGASSRGSGRSKDAGSVGVTAQRISREEACRQLRTAGAIGRAGHAHDEQTSTYDRNLGRDPCH
ncbi:MAG TPA: DUF4124 domain-containing protein [Rudaea sp.]